MQNTLEIAATTHAATHSTKRTPALKDYIPSGVAPFMLSGQFGHRTVFRHAPLPARLPLAPQEIVAPTQGLLDEIKRLTDKIIAWREKAALSAHAGGLAAQAGGAAAEAQRAAITETVRFHYQFLKFLLQLFSVALAVHTLIIFAPKGLLARNIYDISLTLVALFAAASAVQLFALRKSGETYLHMLDPAELHDRHFMPLIPLELRLESLLNRACTELQAPTAAECAILNTALTRVLNTDACEKPRENRRQQPR